MVGKLLHPGRMSDRAGYKWVEAKKGLRVSLVPIEVRVSDYKKVLW